MNADGDHPQTGHETLAQVARVVCAIRPSWPEHLVISALQSHASTVNLGDLAVAAIRAAQNMDLSTPKTIGWRGPHWDGARTRPTSPEPRERCNICGKPEPRCVMERPGADDDHAFEPKAVAS